jgi:glycosyltransferase involved in cell wall biosynthesis
MNPEASPLYGIIEKILSWFGGTIVVLSMIEKEHALKKLFIDQRKVIVIPNGIQIDYPADRVTARRLMGCEDNQFLAGFVGRFVPQKNPLRLIEAFALAAKAEPSLRLALIGSGTVRAEMDAALEAHQLTDKVRYFSGYIGRDLMPGFDCLLSASDYEGFAITFLEALAVGVPIVTTPVGGAHETVIEGETGFMTADFSAEKLAEALVKLATLDPAKRAQMADQARQHARNFSLERMVKQMESLYATLLEKSRS